MWERDVEWVITVEGQENSAQDMRRSGVEEEK